MTDSRPIRRSVVLHVAALFVAAFVFYLLPSILARETREPPRSYFAELARAFLNGEVHLADPSSNYDLTVHEGRWYVPFPPLPALLMLPWVAMFGSLNTDVFSAVAGAANVAVVFLLFEALARRKWTPFSRADNVWMAALFGFGTVHWFLAAYASVWFLAQICTATFAALAVWLAVERDHPVWAGAALAAAMLARPNIALMFPLLLGIAWQHLRDGAIQGEARAALLRWAGLAAIPIALAAGSLLFYNWLRFGDLLDFGYRTANVAPQLVEELTTYGQFNLHYIQQNLEIMVFALPDWDAARARLVPNGLGMSLFLTTPAFFYLLKARRITPLTIGAWTAAGLLLLPLITYYNPGWHQFGYRFSLDFTIPLLVGLAAGLKEPPSALLKALIVLSVLINAWGTVWFAGLY